MKILKKKFMSQNPNLSKIIFKTITFKHIEENIFLLELSATTIIMIIKMLCMFWEDNNNQKY